MWFRKGREKRGRKTSDRKRSEQNEKSRKCETIARNTLIIT